MSVTQVSTAEAYKQNIKSGKLVIVDFYATWCGPCHKIAPKIIDFSKTYENAVFIKVDVDELSDVSQSAGIRAMPTFFLFKNGEKIDEVIGADHKALENKIKAHYK